MRNDKGMAEKTTKADLIEAIHTNGNLNYKEAHALIDAIFDEIKGAMLAGKTIELRGFGTFEVKKRKGRQRARNPKTVEIVAVENHGVASFRHGGELGVSNDIEEIVPCILRPDNSSHCSLSQGRWRCVFSFPRAR